jgi:hypothetical protein
LRSISLPLGTKVLIALLPSKKRHTENRIPQKTSAKRSCPCQTGARASFHPLPNKSVRVRIAGAGPRKGFGRAGFAHHSASNLNPAAGSLFQPIPPEDPLRASTSRVQVNQHHPIDQDLSLGAPIHTDPRRNTAQGFQNTRIRPLSQRKQEDSGWN